MHMRDAQFIKHQGGGQYFVPWPNIVKLYFCGQTHGAKAKSREVHITAKQDKMDWHLKAQNIFLLRLS